MSGDAGSRTQRAKGSGSTGRRVSVTLYIPRRSRLETREAGDPFGHPASPAHRLNPGGGASEETRGGGPREQGPARTVLHRGGVHPRGARLLDGEAPRGVSGDGAIGIPRIQHARLQRHRAHRHRSFHEEETRAGANPDGGFSRGFSVNGPSPWAGLGLASRLTEDYSPDTKLQVQSGLSSGQGANNFRVVPSRAPP